jgi:hypothetical protein
MLTLLEAGHGVMARVSKSAMPEVGDGGGEEGLSLSRTAEWVERAGTIASKENGLGKKILHRKTKRIKLDGTKIINCELANRDKVFDDMWNNENIMKVKRFRGV